MQNNPMNELPTSKIVSNLNKPLICIILGNLIYAIISFTSLPDEIPIHFNLAGEADNWGNKALIFILPLMFKVIFLILYFVSKSPSMINYPVKVTEENAIDLYKLGRLVLTIMNVEMALIMTALTVVMIQTAKGNITGTGLLIPIIIALPIITIIIFMIKIKKMAS
ncbi:DUF1648 domain-containing protein [Ornithinibacillus sp. L9]|uniref:DUF1648 domain-containing protein n=1 Tax=Ornithinibacillus caprae TaxID=2678566 RepID=A0A6N8FL24_9BACI|nr:DUF1648 domain-containing protein [Ornithinibacillus caprae]MUK89054.1 DUF1648 domain-containing protein [Ornithinibacillus caprae]